MTFADRLSESFSRSTDYLRPVKGRDTANRQGIERLREEALAEQNAPTPFDR